MELIPSLSNLLELRYTCCVSSMYVRQTDCILIVYCYRKLPCEHPVLSSFLPLLLAPLVFAFSPTETPSGVRISSVNERGKTVSEHALMNEPGQTSSAAAV